MLTRALAAGMATAADLGLPADDAVVLNDSNRIAVHLSPCDVLARIAPITMQATARFEVEVARALTEVRAPVGELDPRVDPGVHVRDGFAITLWTFYPPVAPAEIQPAEYGDALGRLHAGMREATLATPHVTDRVAEAQRAVADVEETPELVADDRELLADALARLGAEVSGGGAADQPLHGEPHLGNVLRTRDGLLFIDQETCCRGPIELDLAHCLGETVPGHRIWSVAEAAAAYPGADPELVERARILIGAMVTTWRWQRGDQLPNGRYWAVEGLARLRADLS